MIVLALVAAKEPREATLLAERGQAIVPPRQHLPRIALVTDVPHDPVARRLERVQQGHGQFHDPEPGPDVAAGLGDHFDQPLAHLVRQRLQLIGVERPDVAGATNCVQYAHVLSAQVSGAPAHHERGNRLE